MNNANIYIKIIKFMFFKGKIFKKMKHAEFVFNKQFAILLIAKIIAKFIFAMNVLTKFLNASIVDHLI